MTCLELASAGYSVCGEFLIPELEVNELINRLVATDDAEEVRQLYRQWAESYDSDLDQYGYVAPSIGVAIFSQVISAGDAVVHDAGCGTGQVGSLLASYRSLIQSDYTKPLYLIVAVSTP